MYICFLYIYIYVCITAGADLAPEQPLVVQPLDARHLRLLAGEQSADPREAEL
jgi:hypothetical protein